MINTLLKLLKEKNYSKIKQLLLKLKKNNKILKEIQTVLYITNINQKVFYNSKLRIKQYVTAKKLICLIIKTKYNEKYSLSQIAKMINVKSHATALFHYNTACDFIKLNNKYFINQIKKYYYYDYKFRKLLLRSFPNFKSKFKKRRSSN